MIKMKNKKGSILVFSLIIMFIMLSLAVSAALITSSDQRSSIDTKNSTIAFQYANEGLEAALNEIIHEDPPAITVGETASALGETCSDGDPIDMGNYEIIFYDSENTTNVLNCNDTVTGEVAKSIGKYKDTQRAVSVIVGGNTGGAGGIWGQVGGGCGGAQPGYETACGSDPAGESCAPIGDKCHYAAPLSPCPMFFKSYECLVG